MLSNLLQSLPGGRDIKCQVGFERLCGFALPCREGKGGSGLMPCDMVERYRSFGCEGYLHETGTWAKWGSGLG